jgi:hypothetical protein
MWKATARKKLPPALPRRRRAPFPVWGTLCAALLVPSGILAFAVSDPALSSIGTWAFFGSAALAALVLGFGGRRTP